VIEEWMDFVVDCCRNNRHYYDIVERLMVMILFGIHIHGTA